MLNKKASLSYEDLTIVNSYRTVNDMMYLTILLMSLISTARFSATLSIKDPRPVARKTSNLSLPE